MAMTEDLTVYFDPAAFATAATLDWEAVTGIFDDVYQGADVGPFGAAGSNPTYTLPSSQVPADVIGKRLVIGTDSATTDATTYSVVEANPDGTGITVLQLRKV